MKNITKIITICIMLLLISKTVTAQEYQSFDVVSSSDESYNFKCQIKNFTIISTFIKIKQIFHYPKTSLPY